MLRRPDTLTFDEQAKLQQVGALPAAGCRRHGGDQSHQVRQPVLTSTAEHQHSRGARWGALDAGEGVGSATAVVTRFG